MNQRICELDAKCEEEAVNQTPFVLVFNGTTADARFAWGCERHLHRTAVEIQPVLDKHYEDIRKMETEPAFTDAQLAKLLANKHRQYLFVAGFKTRWYQWLRRRDSVRQCCGRSMQIFTAIYCSSGAPRADVIYHGCRWCGRVE